MKKLALLLAVGALTLGAASCSDDSKSAVPGAGPTATETQTAPPAEQPVEPAPSPTVKPGPISLAVTTAKVKGADAQVVTINGWTAYRFEADEDQPSKVNCLNDCLITWPPALTDGSEVQVSGIDPSLVGTVKRADGLVQVTLRGWPLYRFEADKAKFDTKGEGVGGNWSAVKPDGKPVIKKS
jgi:predicted lipoprotein with Yx(FWY)xxD motif